MRTREIFSAKVRQLMGDRSQASVKNAAKKAGYEIDQKTISRGVNEGNLTIDNIEAIAAGLGVPPWQLLIAEGPQEAEMLLALAGLNKEGVRAAIAHAKLLSLDPQYKPHDQSGSDQSEAGSARIPKGVATDQGAEVSNLFETLAGKGNSSKNRESK